MIERPWKVYAHIHKKNRKAYIGITSKLNPNHRWNNGRGYMANPHFYSAIEKYGWDEFEHIILYDNLSEIEAKDMERSLIAFWHTQDRRYGYNMTSGGDGTPDYHPSEETRKKLSNLRRKENLSEETLKRRSDGLRGRKFSDEHKQKIGKALSQPVNMLSKSGELIRSFGSATEAERELGIGHSHISQCCNGKRLTTGGYRWSFAQ